MPRLGVVVAMPLEGRTLAGRNLPPGVEILSCGLGAARAAAAARALLERGASALASWGWAGGLAPGLPPGSLVLPRLILAADQTRYAVDPAWHGRLCRRLEGRVEIHTGPLAESIAALASPAEKKILFRRTGALAADMESAGIAAAARKGGTPFLAIRAVADPAEGFLPACALAAVDEFGRLRPGALLRRLTRHPGELISLFRLGQNFLAARSTLRMVSRLLGGDLLEADSGGNVS